MTPPRPSGPFAVLANRTFRTYWIGQAISVVGAWMQLTAASWVVVSLTHSTAAIGMVAFVSSIPMVLLSLHGGVLADRRDRRKILMATQVMLAAMALLYGWLVGTGRLTLGILYPLSATIGAIVAFDLPAMQAFVPELVSPAELPSAIALNQSMFHGARLIGPALAGVLMAATSTAMAFVANGVSYLAVLYSLAIIRAPIRESRPSTGGWASLKEGLSYVWHDRDVRALIGFTGLTTALVFPFLTVFLALAIKTLFAGDKRTLGFMMSASGMGAMLGALTLLRVGAGWRGRLIVVACACIATCLFAISFARSPGQAVVLVMIMAFCVSLSLGLGTTIIQLTVPNGLRGRVMGVHSMTFTGIMPLVALILGLIADVIELRLTIRVMAIAYACLAIPWLLRARIWGYRPVPAMRTVE